MHDINDLQGSGGDFDAGDADAIHANPAPATFGVVDKIKSVGLAWCSSGGEFVSGDGNFLPDATISGAFLGQDVGLINNPTEAEAKELAESGITGCGEGNRRSWIPVVETLAADEVGSEASVAYDVKLRRAEKHGFVTEIALGVATGDTEGIGADGVGATDRSSGTNEGDAAAGEFSGAPYDGGGEDIGPALEAAFEVVEKHGINLGWHRDGDTLRGTFAGGISAEVKGGDIVDESPAGLIVTAFENPANGIESG